MTIICKPYSELTLAELRGEHAKYAALLSQTVVASAREPVLDVLAILGTWIRRREREQEQEQGVAA
jgi:hypothetical protein